MDFWVCGIIRNFALTFTTIHNVRFTINLANWKCNIVILKLISLFLINLLLITLYCNTQISTENGNRDFQLIWLFDWCATCNCKILGGWMCPAYEKKNIKKFQSLKIPAMPLNHLQLKFRVPFINLNLIWIVNYILIGLHSNLIVNANKKWLLKKCILQRLVGQINPVIYMYS